MLLIVDQSGSITGNLPVDNTKNDEEYLVYKAQVAKVMETLRRQNEQICFEYLFKERIYTKADFDWIKEGF